MLTGLIGAVLAGSAPQAACIVTRVTPTAAEEAPGKPWYVNREAIKVNGKTYVKYGLPRVFAPGELKPFANHGGAIVAIPAEAGATDEVLYVLHRFSTCEFQPYFTKG